MCKILEFRVIHSLTEFCGFALSTQNKEGGK